MLEVFVVVGVSVAIVTVGLYFSGRWAGNLFTGDMHKNLEAGEALVNYERVPERWLKPHRKRIDKLKAEGAGQATIDKAGREAKADVVGKIDNLIRFFQGTNLTDTPDTRDELMTLLHAQRERWASANWQTMFDPPPVIEEEQEPEPDAST
jgi:hypothetical protein